jgi:AcrR family transcriptional regulator
MQKMKSLDNLSNTSKETVARLLDVAEILFSDLGYSGTTVRDIAAKSQINQALINYHFKNKRGLFMAIFERRGKVLFEERLMLLSQARNKAGSKPIPLRDLLYAFIYPPLRIAGESSGGRAFVKLQARLHNEPKEIEQELRSEYYNKVSFQFVDELHLTVPQLSIESIAWRLVFVMGLYIYIASNTGRLEVISRGRCIGSDWEQALLEMLDFCEHGFLAPITPASPSCP